MPCIPLETTKKTILKSGDAEALRALQEEHPEIALIGLGNRVQSAVSKLNKMAVQTLSDPAKIKQVDDSRVEVMGVLNQAVKDLEASKGKPTVGDKIKAWKKEEVTQ